MAKAQKGFFSKIIDSFFDIATIEISTLLALVVTLIVLSLSIKLIAKIPILALVGTVYIIVLIRTVRK
jgi:MFS superfamily sulfate permease-like transporter